VHKHSKFTAILTHYPSLNKSNNYSFYSLASNEDIVKNIWLNPSHKHK